MTWATSMPIFSLPKGLSVLESGPMYATDRRQMSDRQTSDKSIALSLKPTPYRGGGIIRE